MAKSSVFANGELQVVLNSYGLVEDLFYPYIGHENHTNQLSHKIGVWVDGSLSWLGSNDWTHKLRYHEGSAIGHMVATNETLGVLLEFEDFVGTDRNVFGRNIHVVNLRSQQRNIRLFIHQAFSIGANCTPDNALLTSDQQAIIHYSGRRVFVAGGVNDIGQVFDQYSVGLFGNGLEGTWRDAEDGQLSGGQSAHGKTDSTLRFPLTIGGLSSRRIYYWLTAGTTIKSAFALHDEVYQKGLIHSLDVATTWWRRWLTPANRMAERISPGFRSQFIRSLVQLRLQVDRHGAVVSADDGLINYCKPSEASFIIWPLIRLGYKNEVLSYFTFLKHNLIDNNWLAASYRSDGAIGDDLESPYPSPDYNIVATSLFMLTQAYQLAKSNRSHLELYESLLLPLADCLVSSQWLADVLAHRHQDSHQITSHNLSIYHLSLVVACLSASADIADSLKKQDNSVRWRSVADDLRLIVEEQLSTNEQLLNLPDIASLYAVFMFGIVDPNLAQVRESVALLETTLRRPGGLFASSSDSSQPDYVGSLWMAQYYLEIDFVDKAEAIITAVIDKIAGQSIDNLPQSTIVHAELISTLLDTIVKK